jgi:hypothetical protein
MVSNTEGATAGATLLSQSEAPGQNAPYRFRPCNPNFNAVQTVAVQNARKDDYVWADTANSNSAGAYCTVSGVYPRT